MLAAMLPEEFIELQAAYRLAPWGDDWLQTAHIEAAIINTNSTEPVSPYELIPNEDNRQASDEIGPAELAAAARSLAGL